VFVVVILLSIAQAIWLGPAVFVRCAAHALE